MEELKPCPFCGAEDIQICRIYSNSILGTCSFPDKVMVSCSSCGLGGYTEETEEEAVENWNKRVLPTNTKKE